MKKLTPKSTLKEIQSAENKNEWLVIACVFGGLICSIVTCYFWIKHIRDTMPNEKFENNLLGTTAPDIEFEIWGCILISFFVYVILMIIVYAICHINVPKHNFFKFYDGNVISTDVLNYYADYVFPAIPELLKGSDFKFYDTFKEAVILNNNIYFICPICEKPIINTDEDCKEHLEMFLTELRKQKLIRKNKDAEKTKSEISKILENNKNNP